MLTAGRHSEGQTAVHRTIPPPSLQAQNCCRISGRQKASGSKVMSPCLCKHPNEDSLSNAKTSFLTITQRRTHSVPGPEDADVGASCIEAIHWMLFDLLRGSLSAHPLRQAHRVCLQHPSQATAPRGSSADSPHPSPSETPPATLRASPSRTQVLLLLSVHPDTLQSTWRPARPKPGL